MRENTILEKAVKQTKQKSNYLRNEHSFFKRCVSRLSSNFNTFTFGLLILMKIAIEKIKQTKERFIRKQTMSCRMEQPALRVAALVALVVFLGTLMPLPATAQKSAEAINHWADQLVRQPDDPPYFSLHYRLRTAYFSVSPSPKHSVVFLGDSITYGGDWSDLFPNSSAVNRGIGGDSTKGLLRRLDQVVALKPAQIFLMIGTNDLCYNRSIPKITANYQAILERFRDELPETAVYVQSVLPFNDTLFPENGLRNNDEISELNEEIKKLAQQYHYPFIDLTSAFIDEDGRLQKEYTSDGLHLNKAGYLQWRQQIQQYVSSTKKL